MLNLPERFESILQHSDIDFYTERGCALLKERYPNLDIYADIKTIWQAIPDDARVAIYGAGSHTKKLLEVIDLSEKKVVCVVDKLVPNGSFVGYPLIKQHEMQDFGVDTVFLSSLGFKEEIKDEIRDTIGTGTIVDMYDELGKKGYAFTEPFYSQKNYETYLRLYAIKEMYGETNDYRLLSTLIYFYLEMHDFPNAFRFMDAYIQKAYPDAEKYLCLKEAFENLFNEVSTELQKKNKNSVLVFLFDALRYRDVTSSRMPYLSALRDRQGIACTRAYCHAPYTHMSMASIFKQEKLLDDKLYLTSHVDEVPFFEELAKHKGVFHYYGPETQFFNKEHLGPPSNETAPDYFWNYLCQRLTRGDEVDLSFLHCEETHAPFMCGEHTVYPKLYDVYCRELTEDPLHQFTQYEDTLHYLDDQLAFWFPLVSKTTDVMLFSDHGYIFDYDVQAARMHYFIEDTAHIPYYLFRKEGKASTIDRMISHLDTLDIMMNLVQGKDDPFFGLPLRDRVEIDRDFTYSLRDLGLMDEIGRMYLGAAFKCWVFEDYMKYIRYYNGEEELYCLPDEKVNLIADPHYAARLEEIRASVDVSFPAWSEPRWAYAREKFNVETVGA